jgi:hypothetical protein
MSQMTERSTADPFRAQTVAAVNPPRSTLRPWHPVVRVATRVDAVGRQRHPPGFARCTRPRRHAWPAHVAVDLPRAGWVPN